MKTTKFDPTVQAELISEALETGDAKFIAHAIGTVARAQGMTLPASPERRFTAPLVSMVTHA